LTYIKIYFLLGQDTADRRGFGNKKRAITASVIDSVSAAIESDRQITLRDLAKKEGTTLGTMFRILHNELGLVKKKAGWMLKKRREARKKGSE
jgi:hypothetical protein